MSFKLLCLTVTILGLIGCSESENDRIYNQQRRNSSAMENGQRAGIDTAQERVQKAKDFIVQLIANSEASVFEQFPEGFTQETMIQIVQSLSFSGNERFRSGEPILMDHDFEDRKLFYSQQFVAKYGNNEVTNTDVEETDATNAETGSNEARNESVSSNTTQALDSTENLQAIQEITALVLQELSRLMNIGRTEQTKNVSTQFASNLINHLLAETVLCEGQKDNSPFALAINPQTGMSFYVQDKTIADFKQPTNYQVTRTSGSSSRVWGLGSSFPFFDLQGEEASGALEVAVNNLNPEIGVPLHSSYELIEIFQGLLPVDHRVIFLNLQNGQAVQTYQMFYRTEMDSIRANIQESGIITFDLQNLSEARLSIEVQKNNVVDETQSLQIPMICELVSSRFDLQSLLALNESQASQTPAPVNSGAADQPNNQLTEPPPVQASVPADDSSVRREVLNQMLEEQNCNEQDLSEQAQASCQAIQLLINDLRSESLRN